MRLVDLFSRFWKPHTTSGLLIEPEYAHRYPLVFNKTLMGIEIEAEGFRGFDLPQDDALRIQLEWIHKPENSLRDRGIEFVTHPIKGAEVGYALYLLDKMNRNGGLYYSELAGLHVHLNVRDFTVEQFTNLAMLYLVFEDSLYRISGQRQRSIYCLPARTSWSGLSYLIEAGDMATAIGQANKYMGFNYKTIKTFGTVEYRHSKGTPHTSYILHWINTLLRMHIAAKQFQTLELRERLFWLNTNSSYQQFANEIFKEEVDWINCPDLPTEMSEGVSILKEWSIKPHLSSQKILDQQGKGKKKPELPGRKVFVNPMPIGVGGIVWDGRMVDIPQKVVVPVVNRIIVDDAEN